MIIRVLFLSAGAAVRDRVTGQHQVVLLHPSLHKRPVTEGKADVIGGHRMTSWLNYSPVNSSPRSSKIWRQSLCLVYGLSIRSRVPDEGLTVCCYGFSWPLASSALLEASLVRELSPLSICLAVN